MNCTDPTFTDTTNLGYNPIILGSEDNSFTVQSSTDGIIHMCYNLIKNDTFQVYKLCSILFSLNELITFTIFSNILVKNPSWVYIVNRDI